MLNTNTKTREERIKEEKEEILNDLLKYKSFKMKDGKICKEVFVTYSQTEWNGRDSDELCQFNNRSVTTTKIRPLSKEEEEALFEKINKEAEAYVDRKIEEENKKKEEKVSALKDFQKEANKRWLRSGELREIRRIQSDLEELSFDVEQKIILTQVSSSTGSLSTEWEEDKALEQIEKFVGSDVEVDEEDNAFIKNEGTLLKIFFKEEGYGFDVEGVIDLNTTTMAFGRSGLVVVKTTIA